MDETLLRQLETPCIVIDEAKVLANLRAMQAVADAAGVELRPHIKTHKMCRFARLQLACGAKGITCAKVSEAEVMAAGGVDDIFIAYPLVGEFRLRRAMALAARCRRLILAVDSAETARLLSAAATAAGRRVEVRLEVDTGAGRTGVPREEAVALGRLTASLPGLDLTGIYTFKSLLYHGAPTQDRALAGREEGELMAQTAAALRAAGVTIRDLSAGSTPTGDTVARTGLVTEIRPGTYIFNDHMLCCEGWATPERIAAHYYVTVVSTPRPEYAVIDGGTKTFPMDVPLDAPPYHYPGYALVDGRPDLRLRRMNEEHGMLESTAGATGLCVGQILRLTPIHICTAIHQQNTVYLEADGVLTRETVDARGMLV